MLKGLVQRLFPPNWVGHSYPISWLANETVVPTPVVNPFQALRYTPVYRACTLISCDIARIECTISDESCNSLWQNPSTFMSAYEFRRSLLMNALIWGNGFAIINRTATGELVEFLPVLSEQIQLDLSTGRPRYKTPQYGVVEAEDMLHIRAPGLSGIWGESPVNMCRTSMSLLSAQETMALKNFANAGNPKIAIVHPGKLSPEAMQRIERDYMSRHAGSENAGRPLVMAEGVKVDRISSTLDDTGLEAARRYSIGDVSRIYGVPASYLSENVGSAYGNMEWLSRMYVDSCLRQWIGAIEGEVMRKLAAPGERMSWDLDELIRPGIAETMAALRTGVEAGFITRNEARAELDLDPIDGLDDPVLAKNVGAGGGQTNIGTDTSAQAGSPNDFTT